MPQSAYVVPSSAMQNAMCLLLRSMDEFRSLPAMVQTVPLTSIDVYIFDTVVPMLIFLLQRQYRR